MERREAKRSPRRLKVAFGPPGTAQRQLGFAANVSPGGMFIENLRLPPRGTRLRIEVLEKDNPAAFEGIVAHTVDAAQALQRRHRSGIGVRFLQPAELLSAAPRLRPVAKGVHRNHHDGVTKKRVFTLHYADRQAFLEAHRCDIASGDLFIETDAPAAIDALVEVELRVEEPSVAPMRFAARVVHRFEPGGEAAALPTTGMGVELLDAAAALERLRLWTERLQA